MHAVILAAGEGSRMGPHTDDIPKAFMQLGDETLYEYQRDVLVDHVDEVTVVLGYAAENVIGEVTSARTVVVEDWADYENAESLRRGTAAVDDDVLVLNGDVIVAESVVERLVDRHAVSPGRSFVAAIPGKQDGSTAIRCDDRGIVADYGMIRGHRHAGVGIVDRSHLTTVRAYLAANRHEWYPGIYTAVETEMMPISAGRHVEINSPSDKVAALDKLPFDPADGVDLQT
ncbi:NTP transferase domain-containing protein [Halobaculum sp. WSA2]|uniref:NTP transferase domain-containing protein n=1 Tax=Halobaculum saliterrae TaxID=2073113 RepID=A0A6B0SQR5_9EURY|nr:NTP transferase domain-containing protein [Halobaculum saliterrae]MXR39896.1 NTP transferase domain-containing protein [Halobaculum saliterrae]